MCSNLHKPTHTRLEDLQAPQYAAFIANGLMGISLDNKTQARKQTEASLNLILDGVIQDKELCQLYFGELRCSELADRLQQFHSPKRPYGYQHETAVDPAVVEHTFRESADSFKRYINNEVRQLRQKIAGRDQQKTQVKIKTKEAVSDDPALAKIKEELSAKKKFLNKLKPNPRDNEQLIRKLEEAIASLEEQKKSLTTGIKEEVDIYDPDKIKAAKEEIKKLESILDGADVTSRFYKKHKEEFIQYHILPILEAQMQTSVMTYQEQEHQQQQRIIAWIKDILKTHKISLDLDDKSTFSTQLQSNIAVSAHILATEFNLKEHLLNTILELIQILYLEEILNELYPNKDVKIYKPPCVDDIKSRTDCVMRVAHDQSRSVVYVPIDLKNSSDEAYLQAEQKLGTKATLHGLHHCLGNEGKPIPIEPYILNVHSAITNVLLNGIVDCLIHHKELPKKLSSFLTPQEYNKTIAAGHRRVSYNTAVGDFRNAIHQLLGSQFGQSLN